ncbi:MAG: adaptor protein MecA [Clostridia bacterium]|nr:adaptor protein MecA [Clostridia bacterium]
MKIETVNNSKIIIKLTDSEVMLFLGGYSEIIDSSKAFKSRLDRIISKALNSYPDFQNCRDYIVEIKGSTLNGCEIHISKTKAENPQNRRKVKTLVCSFNNTESMIKAICRLYLNYKTRNLTSSVYKLSNKYILIIKSERQNIIKPMLIEYCSEFIKHSYITESYCEEYGTAIALENAIRTIGKHFVRVS